MTNQGTVQRWAIIATYSNFLRQINTTNAAAYNEAVQAAQEYKERHAVTIEEHIQAARELSATPDKRGKFIIAYTYEGAAYCAQCFTMTAPESLDDPETTAIYAHDEEFKSAGYCCNTCNQSIGAAPEDADRISTILKDLNANLIGNIVYNGNDAAALYFASDAGFKIKIIRSSAAVMVQDANGEKWTDYGKAWKIEDKYI